MPTKVYMEALSPTMEEGRVVSWLKNEGEPVSEGDVLAEVETDKATMELVARGGGVLRKRMLGEGETANVGTVIAVIAGEDEDISEIVSGNGAGAQPADEPAPAPAAEPQAATAEAAPGDTAATEAPAAPEPQPAQAAGDGDGRVKASPLARRLAAEAGLQIAQVQGSGPGGRVVKRDIEAAMQEAPAAAAPAEAPAPPAAPAAAAAAQYRDLPLSQMRKTIARRLGQSLGPVPHFFLTIDVDMAQAMTLRQRLNERLEKRGVKISPNDLIIKAVAAALRRHPMVNSSFTGEAIRQYDAVHIGVAVAVEEGLITPVVRDADRKGIGEIATEVKELAGRAREKKLKPDEYTGSTFSISNLGMFGIEEFTAVINPPEAAILAVGAVQDRVVVHDGEIAVRQRMKLTMSCDHRVVDGATGAEFLQTLKSYLEEPMLMIV